MNGTLKNKMIFYLLGAFLFLFFVNDFSLIDAEKTAIIVGMSIDECEDKEKGNYTLAFQVATPQGKEESQKQTQNIIKASGVTVSEAISKLSLETGWYPKLSYCNLVIVSHKLAKNNIMNVLEFFISTEKMQDSALLAITTDNAAEVLSSTAPLNSLSTFSLQKIMLGSYFKSSDVAVSSLKDFCTVYYSFGADSYISNVELVKDSDDKKDKQNKSSESSSKNNDVKSSADDQSSSSSNDSSSSSNDKNSGKENNANSAETNNRKNSTANEGNSSSNDSSSSSNDKNSREEKNSNGGESNNGKNVEEKTVGDSENSKDTDSKEPTKGTGTHYNTFRTAVFDQGRLVSLLSKNETECFNMLIKRIKNAPYLVKEVTIPSENKNSPSDYELNISSGTASITQKLKDDKIFVSIKLKIIASILDTNTNFNSLTDLTSKGYLPTELKDATKSQLTRDLTKLTVNLKQNNSDILRIGNELMKFDNKNFKEFLTRINDPNEYLKNAIFDITVSVEGLKDKD